MPSTQTPTHVFAAVTVAGYNISLVEKCLDSNCHISNMPAMKDPETPYPPGFGMPGWAECGPDSGVTFRLRYPSDPSDYMLILANQLCQGNSLQWDDTTCNNAKLVGA